MASGADRGQAAQGRLAALRSHLPAPARRSGRARGVAVALALVLAVAGASVGLAEDDAGVMDHWRREAAQRLPAPVARIVAPPPARMPARFASISSPPVTRRVAVAAPQAPAASPRRAMCVRLCDGYYFPAGSGDRGAQQASCEAACPGASVALFTLPAGSGDMGRARGLDGLPYRALPQAFAHQRQRVAACSCQGPDNVARRIDPASDRTLRRGDVLVGLSTAMAFTGEPRTFEEFRRSRALSPAARRQVDRLLAVSAREARREAFLRTMQVVRIEPAHTAGLAVRFAPVDQGSDRVPGGFAAVRTVLATPFVTVN